MPLLLVVAAVPVFIALRFMTAPTTAARVARFARRHRVGLMPGSEPYVVAYLSHTRRWRTAGVLGGYLVGLASALPQERIALEFLPLLTGWLVGAVVAEFRFRFRAPLGPGLGAAPADAVVPGWVLRVPHAVAATSVGVTALVLAFGRADERSGHVLAWGTGAVACAAVVAATNRYVVDRLAGSLDAVTTAERAVAGHAVGAITAVGAAVAVSCLAHETVVARDEFFNAAATAVDGIGLLWTVGVLVIAWLIAAAARGGAAADSVRGTRPLARVLLVVAALVVVSAGWAGYAWWKDRPPYSAAAVQAAASVRFTDEKRFEDDASALGITGFTTPVDQPEQQQFIGRVDHAMPAGADADDTYCVFVIDKRKDRVAPMLYDAAGGFWGSSLSELARRYTWLSATAPTFTDAGYSYLGSAVSKPADAPGPITFVGSFPSGSGMSPSDLMVVLVLTGADGQIYWATRVAG